MKWILALILVVSYSAHAISAPASKSNRLPAKKAPVAARATPAPTPAPMPESGSSANDALADDDSPSPIPEERKRPALETMSSVQINYTSAAWNKSSDKIDEASILMRENISGRVVQLRLFETTPDSGVFSGLYSVNWTDLEKLQVEFYIPPQSLIATKKGMGQLVQMISAKELKRNPFILRRSARGQQSVEVFDTKDQAVTAMTAYRAEQKLLKAQALSAQQLNTDGQPKKVLTQQEIETARQAEEQRQKAAAANAEAERARMEQSQADHIRELMAKESALKESEKAAHRAQAAQLAEQGLALFKDEKFPEARDKFDQAVTLDPDNRSFYYKYGVALYKTETFNRSLVLLQMADGPDVNVLEKQYFIALNYFRLKDYDSSIAAFEKVIESKDAQMAPSAQFYKGVVLFEKQSWELAQKAFQDVLDTSKDPKLDERAEAYLEQILRIRQFEEERKRKWLITATLGEMYDQNVLLISDSQRDTGAATDAVGWRSLLSGSLRYRPVYDQKNEFAAQVDVMTMYTLDKSLKSVQTLRNADPTVATLTLPWTHKGLVWGKGYKFDVTPGYESTYMSIENNQNKQILSSYLLTLSNLFVMSDTWYANYNLEARSDQAHLDAATGDNDSSAAKFRLVNSNLIFLTTDKAKIMTAEGSFTMNQAVGRNSIYNRIDVGVGYIQPWIWDMAANLKLGYFRLSYPQNDSKRVDNSVTASAGVSRKINDVWSTGLLIGYNVNGSSVSDNAYNKFTALLTLSSAVGF